VIPAGDNHHLGFRRRVGETGARR